MTLLREPTIRAMIVPPVALRGVGAGFVERIDPREIILDHPIAQLLKNHPRGDAERLRLPAAQVGDENPGGHLVSPATEQAQDAHSLGAIGGFAEHLVSERDERVCGQDDGVGMGARDGESFA